MSGPLLGVRIPEALGRQTEGFTAPGPGGLQLAIVLQAFDDVRAQTCLAGICGLYIQAGVRLLAVESADDRIVPEPGRLDLSQLIRSSHVSAGVLSLINAGAPSVEAWGVDDLSLIPPSYQAMERVSGARRHRDRLFEKAIQPMLRTAQEAVYPGQVAELRRSRLDLYGSRKPVLEQARLARAAARRVGLDLTPYPLVLRFLDIGEKEQSQNPAQARQQMEEFLRRVVTRTGSWVKAAGGNRLTIDLEKAAPVLEFWLRETGQSVDEFYAAVRGPNPEPVFRACRQWYDAWFKSQATGGNQAAFFENLMRLALYLEVPYFDLRDFREHIAQSRDTEALRTGLDDELGELATALVDRAGGSALGEIEDRFDLMYRMSQLAVGSRDAEARVRSIGTVAETIELLHAAFPATRDAARTEPADLAAVESSLAAAKDFLRLSRERSAHMVKRTLELMGRRNEDRAVLAIGGFHARAVTRVMDDYPQVSWAILMPQVDVDSAWKQHKERF